MQGGFWPTAEVANECFVPSRGIGGPPERPVRMGEADISKSVACGVRNSHGTALGWSSASDSPGGAGGAILVITPTFRLSLAA